MKRKPTKIKMTYTTGDTAYTDTCFNAHAGTADGSLAEAKRYVRRYYIRPQNVFCSNKYEILQALLKISDANENCTIYTLNNLGDNKDVHKLTNNDIIYYYDDNILYDKNHVKVIDYDLAIKHEEDRDKINVATTSEKTFKDVYDDRMTLKTDLSEAANPFDLDFCQINEEKANDTCCICGEDILGYGNNAEPYAHGRCCDACNLKFVIPARIRAMKINSEKDYEDYE